MHTMSTWFGIKTEYDTYSAMSMDLDDVVGCRHLKDQVPIVGNGHELVHGHPAQDSIEGEADLYNIEEGTICVVVLWCPKHHREGDTTTQHNGHRAHSREWVQGGELQHQNL
jgi:hypothetical protein